MAHQPKAYKKFVATAATAALVASAVAPVVASAAFTDVNSNYKDAVDYLVKNGIANGVSDSAFGTTQNITRGDAAVMIANAFKLDTANAKDQGFTDLNARVKGAVNAIVEAGYASGKTKTTFDPTANITRQEMAKIIANAYGLKAEKNANFSDVNSNWIGYVSALKEAGITSGKTETTFAPTANLTRGEFALFLYRAETNAPAVPATPEVVSVSAINAKQIQVTFNQAADSLTALNRDNYKLQTNTDNQAVSLSTVDATAELTLSEDGKTLTITTTTEINAQLGGITAGTPFKFTVDGVSAKTGVAFEKKTVTISSKDEVAPKFLTATSKARTTTTKVTLEFSEPVDVAGAIAYVGGQAATVAQGSTPTTVTLTTSQALEANKEYDLTLLNFKDFAGNFLDSNPTNTKFTVTSDVLAPVVQEVKVVRDNLVEVTFDKAMDASTFAGNARILDVNGVVQGGGLTATIKPNTSGKTVRLLTASAVPFNNSGTFAGTLVLADSIKDASGNAKSATSHNVTLTKDTVKPTVASASYIAPNSQYAGNTYANGAIVVKLSEEVALGTADYKIISSSGEVSSVTVTPAVNSHDAKEVILTLSAALATDTYTLRVGNDSVEDLSTQKNKNVAGTTTVKVDGSSDTQKPVVDVTGSTGTAATSQTSGSSIVVNIKDNVGLDLATVQNVNNYLLDGKPLPSGTYVTIAHVGGSSATAATEVNATLNIPAKAIAKSGNYTLNVNNIKDKAGNTADPKVQSSVALVDDISPELTKAEISSNGLLVLTFSEAVTSSTLPNTLEDFDFEINGVKVVGANLANIATVADGVGTDQGKYVVTINAEVDATAGTAAGNFIYLDVDGSGAFNSGDIKIQTGTSETGSIATLDINKFSSFKVTVADNQVIKDTSSLNNPIKKGNTITVK